ncbi:MAG: helix-turn-helix transcriptional regulator [Lachnospiraceae bacterium]|nr:helix-turn-helix transcriptional regulator [Lachnospiraceae bacterium]
MKKSVLGNRIHALRKERDITQEELGKAVGVTAQAVSNWECGGTPDAELLPRIADYFEVSVDNLFGRTDEIKKDPGLEIMWDLYHTPKEQRFEKAYQYCWCIQQGLFNLAPDLFSGTLKDNLSITNNVKSSSILFFDEGISMMRLNEAVHNFMLIPTPAEGLSSCLLSPEAYEQFFATLGKPDRIKTLLFLYQRKSLALSAAKLAKYMNMKEETITEIMQDLLQLELVQTFETDTDNGEVTLYRVQEYLIKSIPMISLLIMAGDMIEKSVAVFANTTLTRNSIL